MLFAFATHAPVTQLSPNAGNTAAWSLSSGVLDHGPRQLEEDPPLASHSAQVLGQLPLDVLAGPGVDLQHQRQLLVRQLVRDPNLPRPGQRRQNCQPSGRPRQAPTGTPSAQGALHASTTAPNNPGGNRISLTAYNSSASAAACLGTPARMRIQPGHQPAPVTDVRKRRTTGFCCPGRSSES